jgi:hypothetical protein
LALFVSGYDPIGPAVMDGKADADIASSGPRRVRARDIYLAVPSRGRIAKESLVADVVFTLVTAMFFAIAILYLRGCERLK